jgi:Fur family zinc uptake transcriptional regulator
MENPTNNFVQFNGHDHAGCVRQALLKAEQVCREKGIRLTPLRREVLTLVWENHRPVGAYQLLEQLRLGGQAKPPTVYRALDFLQQAGLVHRLATLNAYVGCPNPEEAQHGPFLICSACQALVELTEKQVNSVLRSCTEAVGFQVTAQIIELHGLCPCCQETTP